MNHISKGLNISLLNIQIFIVSIIFVNRKIKIYKYEYIELENSVFCLSYQCHQPMKSNQDMLPGLEHMCC